MHNFKSHFWWDFLAYCTRPASVHLLMAFIGCSFDSFSIFLLSLKQQQNLMKIMFSCIHFSIWPPPPPPPMKKLYFILANCMGWQVWMWRLKQISSDKEKYTKVAQPYSYRILSSFCFPLFCTCMHTHSHTHTHTHMHTHLHMHTHTGARMYRHAHVQANLNQKDKTAL